MMRIMAAFDGEKKMLTGQAHTHNIALSKSLITLVLVYTKTKTKTKTITSIEMFLYLWNIVLPVSETQPFLGQVW